jgi:hypothetical protein
VPHSPFGSHVLETLLGRVHDALSDEHDTTRDAALSLLDEWVFLVREDITDYATNKYSTHVVRALIRLLAQRGAVAAHSSGSPSATVAGAPSATAPLSGLEEKIALVQSRTGVEAIRNLQPSSHSAQDRGSDPSSLPDSGGAGGKGGVDVRLQGALAALAAVLSGPQLDSATFRGLERSSCASPVLQALLKVLPDGCDTTSEERAAAGGRDGRGDMPVSIVDALPI